MVWAEETIALAKALQSCAICCRIPLGVLCGAMQEHHEYLASIIQSGNFLDLGMLNVAEKDSVAPASEDRAPSSIPRAEQPISITASSMPSTSEPGEATQPEEFTLVPRQRPLPSPGFSHFWANDSDQPPLEQAFWPMHMPWGAQLDFVSFGVHMGDSLTLSSDG